MLHSFGLILSGVLTDLTILMHFIVLGFVADANATADVDLAVVDTSS